MIVIMIIIEESLVVQTINIIISITWLLFALVMPRRSLPIATVAASLNPSGAASERLGRVCGE